MRTLRRGTPPSRRRGAALVEFAVVAPLIFLLVLGLVEFTRLVMVQQAITNCAREGCRKAILASTVDATSVDNAVKGHLQTSVANSGNINKFTVAVSPAPYPQMAAETEITVSVQVNFADVSFIPASFLGNVVLRSTTTMKRE